MPLQIVIVDPETGSAELFPVPSEHYRRVCDFLESLALPTDRPLPELPRPGRPGIPVVVTAVDPEAAQKFNVKVGDRFESAVALSYRLDFNFNAGGQALGRNARALERAAQVTWDREGHPGKHTVRIRPEATLRGITFMLEKDLPG